MKSTITIRGAVMAAGALLLHGCNSSDANDPGIYKAEWSRLEDGSSFATKSDGENRAAYRCWPHQGRFECLVAGQGVMGSIQVARTSYGELPGILIPFAAGDPGYKCSTVLGREEEAISAPDGDLITNDNTPRWSQRFVKDYMTKNKVDGQLWFPCLKTLKLVQQGSLATLRTTSVTEDLLGN
jgi:hypothetical protein